ncbi:hypothetical protein S506_004834 [Salmonella enterica subsp. enterica serovar Oranienburg]|nr:hypothetical protein [Salmonella enterica]EDR5905772.1 hypothetical protein [Salmonella enterica subsp. enterica serovar Oranienburg]EDT7407770.1 hypothetical protein [Salmonella enterica subsp. enterica]EDW0832611.1 hypothetical protein [Salmonella enterica subsp. enterica serovar Anatum]EDW4673625.1 hypothetical protein [Salmonella enterica subsp. salamae]
MVRASLPWLKACRKLSDIFVLDDARYQAFIKQLEAPVQNTEGRQRLMDVKPEWK